MPRANACRRLERPTLSVAASLSDAVSHSTIRGFFPRTQTYFETRQQTTDILLGYIIGERFVQIRTLPPSARFSACRNNSSDVGRRRLSNVF